MKLYLASVHIPDEAAFASLFAPGKTHRLALVANAWDVASGAKSEPFITGTEGQIQQLKSLGMQIARLDLRQYIGKTAELAQELAKYSGVWVTGGNSFYLNMLFKQTGFKEAIAPLLAKGFVYGGESAGAVVAGTTLHGIEQLDDPNEAPGIEVVWEGLGLVPYGLIPHWGEQAYATYLEACKAEMEHFTITKTLTNQEHLIINS